MANGALAELEQWLWGAANLLRGPIDNSDFKAYIFPLLFFKRVSDVYDEEYEKAIKEAGYKLLSAGTEGVTRQSPRFYLPVEERREKPIPVEVLPIDTKCYAA